MIDAQSNSTSRSSLHTPQSIRGCSTWATDVLDDRAASEDPQPTKLARRHPIEHTKTNRPARIHARYLVQDRRVGRRSGFPAGRSCLLPPWESCNRHRSACVTTEGHTETEPGLSTTASRRTPRDESPTIQDSEFANRYTQESANPPRATKSCPSCESETVASQRD